jgi:hypothetical protein
VGALITFVTVPSDLDPGKRFLLMIRAGATDFTRQR